MSREFYLKYYCIIFIEISQILKLTNLSSIEYESF